MKTIVKFIITTFAVLVASYIVPGVIVPDFQNAMLFAIVLGLINIFIKPLFILLTLPFTIFSFGLFLLLINAFMIEIADYFIDSVKVGSFWNAFLFSLWIWMLNSLFEKFQNSNDGKKEA